MKPSASQSSSPGVPRRLAAGIAAALLMSGAARAESGGSPPPAENAPATVLLVTGAAGEEKYARTFEAQTAAWREAAAKAGARVVEAGSGPAAADTPDADVLRRILAEEKPDGREPLWIVLTGHNTWDGKVARFNLRGPDIAASELADLLKRFTRPLIVIVTGSSSAPFLNELAGPKRIVITATRSGSEQNYARFGEHLAAVLDDPAGDLDSDGGVSLLEAFLSAAHRTREFYQSEGRLLTEHALIDDNGDGKGTPAEWFTGLRADRRSADASPLDGAAARRVYLVPPESDRALSAEDRARRDSLEDQVAALRELKPELEEAEYFRRLEEILLELARIQEKTAGSR